MDCSDSEEDNIILRPKRYRPLVNDDVNNDYSKKAYLVCIGSDKKAFEVPIDLSKCFPPNDPKVPDLIKRQNFAPGEAFSMYWVTGGKRELINVFFKQYAQSKQEAQHFVDILSQNIKKKVVSKKCDEKSVSTTSLLQVDLNISSDMELNEEIDTSSISQMEDNMLQVLHQQMDASVAKAVACSNTLVKSKTKGQPPPDSIVLQHLVPTLQQVILKLNTVEEKLDRFVSKFDVVDLRVNVLKDSVQEGFDEMVVGIKNIAKVVNVVQKSLTKKDHIVTSNIVPKNKLFENDEELLWFVEGKNMVDFVNKIYLETTSLKSFVISLYREMYGDLISLFKFEVIREYADGSRKTRPPLKTFDPTGKVILQKAFDRYFDVNCDLKINGAQPSRDIFNNYCITQIDVFSLRTNAKKGLKNPYSKECLFFKYVVQENCNPRLDFSEDDRKWVAKRYKKLAKKTATSKEAKRSMIGFQNDE